MGDKIYFGHPVNTYNTELERILIEAIKQRFPGCEIENPNQPKHAEGYQAWKQEKGDGMEYFLVEVLPKMDKGVFLAFEDGMLGAGVYKEAEFMHCISKEIFEINHNQDISFIVLDPSRKLSVEETRERVYE
ncbi:MAG: hypothetical protein V3V78_00370 [Candidatus Woesearchaeota archaeon]